MQETCVAIIGAGPTGLTLGALLKRRGIDAIVLEERDTLHLQPQAHSINARTLEIMRELGADRSVIRAATPQHLLNFFFWGHSLVGPEYARAAMAALDPSIGDGTPAVWRINLAQNLLEPIIYDALCEAGGSVRFGTRALLEEQDDDGVTLRLEADEGTTHLRTRYVVACDGASSPTRANLGIAMRGPASLQKYVTIYFKADLGRVLIGRRGPLHWIMNADVRGAFIGFDVKEHWALLVPYASPHSAEEFTLAVCEGILRKAIGDPLIDFAITSIGSWNMSAQVSERFQSGRVFIAGDAAHRFPPTGGLGLNSGVQDAHNLAWKLADVLRGHAASGLLDSYELERLPVAQENCEFSVGNAVKLKAAEDAIGFSKLREGIGMSQPVSPSVAFTPPPKPVDLGIDETSDAGRARRARINGAVAATYDPATTVGQALGFVYAEGTLIGDGSPPGSGWNRAYKTNSRPGGRLAHFWLTQHGRRISTIDLAGNGYFLLAGTRASAIVQAATRAAARFGLPLRPVELGRNGFADPSDGWTRLLGLDHSQAVLVRPDGHVAWRSDRGTPAAAANFDEVFGTLTGKAVATVPTEAFA